MSASGGAGGCNKAAPVGPSPLEWKFSQVLGERAPGEEIQDVDIISAIEFERKGEYLATGDHGGRVVIFERSDKRDHYSRRETEHYDYPAALRPKYIYKMEFQSHEPEFDYLKSLEIEEKINKLRWCASPNNSLFILSANNRTIKLWKIQEQKVKKVKEMFLDAQVFSENVLLSEKSFMVGQNGPFIPNGHHVEWADKTLNNMSPSTQEDRQA